MVRTSFCYKVAALAGLTLTPFAVRAAYIQRGYFAVGGELLVPVLFVLMVVVGVELRGKDRKEGHKKSTHRGAQIKVISLR